MKGERGKWLDEEGEECYFFLSYRMTSLFILSNHQVLLHLNCRLPIATGSAIMMMILIIFIITLNYSQLRRERFQPLKKV